MTITTACESCSKLIDVSLDRTATGTMISARFSGIGWAGWRWEARGVTVSAICSECRAKRDENRLLGAGA